VIETAVLCVAPVFQPTYDDRMALVTIELPTQRTQTRFYLRLRSEWLADAELSKFESRVGSDRHGHMQLQ
jgi:hypothetical protein